MIKNYLKRAAEKKKNYLNRVKNFSDLGLGQEYTVQVSFLTCTLMDFYFRIKLRKAASNDQIRHLLELFPVSPLKVTS